MSEPQPVAALIAEYGQRLPRRCDCCGWLTLFAIGASPGAFVACSWCDTTADDRERFGLVIA